MPDQERSPGYVKMVVTGHIIEIYTYEKTPLLPGKKREKRKESDLDQEEITFDNSLKDRQNNMMKARNKLRRLISANFDHHSKFITLTFADNLSDVKQANLHFKKFVMRLRYKYGSFKYIAVVEFQKRGAVHYHMISNLPYIENSLLSEIWGHGFVKINDVTHVDNVGAYMIKYMTKDSSDTRLMGLKSYQASRNLERPMEYIGDEAERILNLYGLEKEKSVFHSTYETEHLGQATYYEYNLKRL